MNFPKASTLNEYRNKRARSNSKPMALDKVARRFIDTTLLDKIMSNSSGNYVNVEVPMEAYCSLTEFHRQCSLILEPLGYKVEMSGDGAGMYDTLFVSW